VRIVSLLSSATEILFAIGAADQVVAISHECDYPPESQHLPRATRSLVNSSRPSHEIDEQVKRLMEAGEPLYEIDRELIRRLQPDLIVTQAQCDVCAVRYQDVVDFVAAELALARAKVLDVQPHTLDDILRDVICVGEAAEASRSGREYAESLNVRIKQVAAKGGAETDGAAGRQRPRVICLEWTDPIMTAGNWTPGLIELAGGHSCLAYPGRHSTYAPWDSVRANDCDVLLVAPCGFGLARSQQEAQRLVALPGFTDLTAVRSGRTFVIDGNAYLNRSGPRIVDSLEILAYLIRPDLFEPPSGELAEGRAWARL